MPGTVEEIADMLAEEENPVGLQLRALIAHLQAQGKSVTAEEIVLIGVQALIEMGNADPLLGEMYADLTKQTWSGGPEEEQ